MECRRNRALTRQYNYRQLLSRSGVEIHLPGEQWISTIIEFHYLTYLGVRETRTIRASLGFGNNQNQRRRISKCGSERTFS